MIANAVWRLRLWGGVGGDEHMTKCARKALTHAILNYYIYSMAIIVADFFKDFGILRHANGVDNGGVWYCD